MIVGRPAALGSAAKAEFIKHGKRDGKKGKATGMPCTRLTGMLCNCPQFCISISFCLAGPDKDSSTCLPTRAQLLKRE